MKMRTKLIELSRKYNYLMDEINGKKANGSLSELCNLRTTFDETFDAFFDRKELRVKYENAWDNEADEANFEVGNSAMEDMLTEADLKDYVEFYEDYIGRLEDELAEYE